MPGRVNYEEIAIGICQEKALGEPTFVGIGSFKEAYLTKTADNFPVALKIFNPDKSNLCRTEREISSMLLCESSCIAKIYNFGIFEHNDKGTYQYIIEEYLAGGTLTDRLDSVRNSPIHVYLFGTALLKAISLLKDKSLVHRDIKPDNIMFRGEGDSPVLVDFGLVRDLSATSLTQTFLAQGPGTAFYASPEQLNNEKHLIDWRSDQFSVGVVLGICLTGDHPYRRHGQSDVQVVNQVASRQDISSTFAGIASQYGCGFLTKMVSPWPVDRFSKPEVVFKELESLKKGLPE